MASYNKQDSSVVTVNLPSGDAQAVNTNSNYNYVVGAYSSGTTLDTNINNFRVQQTQGHGWCQAQLQPINNNPTYFDVSINSTANTGTQRTAKFNIVHTNSNNKTSFIMLNINQPEAVSSDTARLKIRFVNRYGGSTDTQYAQTNKVTFYRVCIRALNGSNVIKDNINIGGQWGELFYLDSSIVKEYSISGIPSNWTSIDLDQANSSVIITKVEQAQNPERIKGYLVNNNGHPLKTDFKSVSGSIYSNYTKDGVSNAEWVIGINKGSFWLSSPNPTLDTSTNI